MHNYIIIHLISCFLYLLIFYRKRDLRFVCRALIIILLPIVGIILYIIMDIGRKFIKMDLKEVSFDLEDEPSVAALGPARRVNYSKEVNVVPIEEALIINSDNVKRKMIFDILKEDSLAYLAYFEKALDSSDSETSHYAAAVILDTQRKFMLAMQEFAVKYEKEKDNIEMLVPYSEVLKNYLSSSLLDDKSKRKYQYVYSQVLENILRLRPEVETFVAKIDMELELKEYEKAKACCNEFLKLFGTVEEPYIMLMKYYYQMNDRSGFNDTLAALKNSNVKFSKKSLEIVRFW